MRTSIFYCLIILSISCLACGGGSGGSEAAVPAVDAVSSTELKQALSRWQQQMQEYGQQHCSTLQANTDFDTQLGATYYDGIWVYQQIKSYTGQGQWQNCINAARSVYRDRYVLANSGQVPGYWNFSHGLSELGDGTSKSAIIALRDRAGYSSSATPLAASTSTEFSREVAFAIMTHLHAVEIGQGDIPRLTALKEQALEHLRQWRNGQTDYVRPFMVALTAQALIEYDQKYHDSAILIELQSTLNWLWDKTWLEGAQAFKYTDRSTSSGGTEAAPDLNLLIAPAYFWIYQQTGQTGFLAQADKIFIGGVNQAFLGNPKQFNQNYRWIFSYVNARF